MAPVLSSEVERAMSASTRGLTGVSGSRAGIPASLLEFCNDTYGLVLNAGGDQRPINDPWRYPRMGTTG